MGSFPAARSISSVKALLSQVPPEGEQGNPAGQTALIFSPLALPSALPWLWLSGLCTHTTSKRWRLAYRAQEGMQSQAPATGRTSYSLLHLHRDQAEIHYS